MLQLLTLVVVLIAASLLSACRGVSPRPLAPQMADQLEAVQQAPASTGEQIYEGRVYALDGRTEPLFRFVPPSSDNRPRSICFGGTS